jgi:hypothetical protein
MIEAGAVLVTLLFIIAQMRTSLPEVRPIGDLFSAACLLILGVLVASGLMLFSPEKQGDAVTVSFRLAGRSVVFLSFFFGLAMLVDMFLELAYALNTKVNLIASLAFILAAAVAVFLFNYRTLHRH